ncbi:alanine dehydrogenase [Flavobacteriaceae bacterium]|nr:alanine dehydrogenase [Flavobacteriaceae bacterium]MDA9245088.1 alanine dehydrogenase [Flavobacteriaceae bacterium]MDB4113338.1 alanine dehydrogenase [Flavobacteriaceae bacterium]
MIIGTPKEIKNNEFRVGLNTASVMALTNQGHRVLLETSAGMGSGMSDEDYIAAGATIVASAEEVFAKADMIVKVKEPLAAEYELIRAGQIVFTYFHFASSLELTEAMIKSKAICIAYETVEDKQGRLPLLTPMSEVAGRMSIQQGAKYLEKPQGGKGQLLGGVPGSAPAKVMIIGAGVVGTEAAKMAAGLGAQVLLLDINLDRLRYLSEILPPNVTPLYSSQETIAKNISDSDLIIGAVLIPGAKAPNIISRKMLQKMEAGTVLVDVAVDQGGCFETCQPTTHEEPTFVVDEIVHYCVANIPGAVPMTSTNALNNTTLPLVLLLANQGWKQACTNNEALKKGLSIYDGKIVHAPVANTFDLPLYDNAI